MTNFLKSMMILGVMSLSACGDAPSQMAGKSHKADLIQVDVGGGRGGGNSGGGLIHVDLGGGRWCRPGDWNCIRR